MPEQYLVLATSEKYKFMFNEDSQIVGMRRDCQQLTDADNCQIGAFIQLLLSDTTYGNA